MLLFLKRFSSLLTLIVFSTTFLAAQSVIDTVREKSAYHEPSVPLQWSSVVAIEPDLMGISDADHAPIVSDYPRFALTKNSDLDLNKNTLNVSPTFHDRFKPLHYFETGDLNNDANTFQKNLYINNISLKSGAFRRALIAPVLFTAAGLSILDDDSDDNYEVQQERNRYIPNFRYRVDDYVQHAPIIVVYGLNWLGVEGKNDFANRTAILIKSEMMVGMLTFSLKRLTAVPRPDTKEQTSFPSGHTAQAFATATFMAKEYGHKSIWYSIGAYTMATGVGAMRVMNNRHWVSDVLVGAGIGILSTNLVYLTHQYRWGKKNKSSHTSIMPSYDGQTGMVNIIHRIN